MGGGIAAEFSQAVQKPYKKIKQLGSSIPRGPIRIFISN